MTARPFTIELGKLTELLASGDVAGAQALLDRCGGRSRHALLGDSDACEARGISRVRSKATHPTTSWSG